MRQTPCFRVARLKQLPLRFCKHSTKAIQQSQNPEKPKRGGSRPFWASLSSLVPLFLCEIWWKQVALREASGRLNHCQTVRSAAPAARASGSIPVQTSNRSVAQDQCRGRTLHSPCPARCRPRLVQFLQDGRIALSLGNEVGHHFAE